MNSFVKIKKIMLELFTKLGHLNERQSLNLSDFARAAQKAQSRVLVVAFSMKAKKQIYNLLLSTKYLRI